VIQCPTCKQELQPGVRFCPHDGTPLTETSASDPTRTPSEPTVSSSPPTSKELALPLVIGGRYRLTELRGGGGMAKVYRAVDVTLEREVAVKLINQELRNETEFDARFQREARIASQLSDPHIIVVHDFGIDAEHGPYLVMEYLQGQSLRERLQSEGPLPLRAGLQLSAQLLLALIHAHGKNIVHRDIKPDNIFLLNQSGVRLHVRVLDFGIARIYRRGEAGNAETLTHPGAVLGTPRYMSPEQLAGQPIEIRSDLYSAALVIHEAITGQLPYVSGKKLCELCPEASPALQDLLDQCLKPNPAERPPSAVEVYLRLQELGKASGILLLPPGAMDKLVASRQSTEPTIEYTPPAPPRARLRRRALVGLAMLLVAVAAVWLVKHFYFTARPVDRQHESLSGVHIGDPQQGVVEKLKLVKGGPLNPWTEEPAPGYVGHVLRPEDLGLPAEALPRLDVQRSADDKICVIFFEDKVRAVIAREAHAATARGLKVLDHKGRVLDVYPEDASEDQYIEVRDSARASRKIEIRRYDALGIGFEMHEKKVTAITLYPLVTNP
jgi:tRNA A-37 threonylcarbamoyl transferase component Bud32